MPLPNQPFHPGFSGCVAVILSINFNTKGGTVAWSQFGLVLIAATMPAEIAAEPDVPVLGGYRPDAPTNCVGAQASGFCAYKFGVGPGPSDEYPSQFPSTRTPPTVKTSR